MVRTRNEETEIKRCFLLLLFLLAISGGMSAQQVLFICSAQLPCPGFALGSVQAGVDQNGWRNFKLTLIQNVTSFSFVGTPPPAQAAVNVIFTEDAVGGRTVTFASNISNPCTITTTANATTLCQFEFDGTVGTWFGISGSGGTCAQGTCVVNAPTSTQTVTSSATQDLKLLSSATNSFIDFTPKDPTFGVPILTLDSETNGDTAINFNQSGVNHFSFYHHNGGEVLAVAESDVGAIDVLNIASGITSLHGLILGDQGDVGHTVSGQIQWFGATSGSCVQNIDATSTTITSACPNFTISAVGAGNGRLGLSGTTSGTATITAPAVAGTLTNPIAISNNITVGNGSNAAPGLAFTGSTTTGLWNSGGTLEMTQSGISNHFLSFGGTPVVQIDNVGIYGFSSSGSVGVAGNDTGVSRSAADVIALGNGTQGDTTGRVKAAGYMSVGTTFTSNAGCGDTTLTGGATAGKYTSVTAGTCTTIITMGNSATAPNGWSCSATDLTTIADAGNIHQTATSTTTASLNEGTVVANDVIQFSCLGY